MSGSMTFVERALRPLLILSLLLIASCGPNQVEVNGNFPSPLMDPLPLNIGVYYDEAFANHEFFDQAKSRTESDWIVKTGQAQVQMWDTLFAGMFENFTQMRFEPAPEVMNQAVDAVLIPEIDELQYAIPAHTNVKVYEIWMRYKFRLVTQAGDPIAEWTMTAYGKTPTAFLRSNEAAVNLAAVMALRDAGANFATGFRKIPAVQAWMASLQPQLDGVGP